MPRVLIADDNVQNAELFEAHLDGNSWETRIATDGEDTLAQVESFKPDLLLLDVMMPKLSGFEVCKRVRLAHPTLGILMVTALDQPSDTEKAINAGTDDFLTKPIQKSELLLRVKALLDVRHLTDETERSLAYFRQVSAGA